MFLTHVEGSTKTYASSEVDKSCRASLQEKEDKIVCSGQREVVGGALASLWV
jgi:hypothetical protein